MELICCLKVEGLRAAIEAEVTAYALNHYRHGVSATFSKPTEVNLSCTFVFPLSQQSIAGWQIHCVLYRRSSVPAKELLERALAQPMDCRNIWTAGRGHWCPQSPGGFAFGPESVTNFPTIRCIIMRMAMSSWSPPKRWRRVSHLAMMQKRPKSWWSSWRIRRQSTRLP